ncbi:MAG TPA: hypothetical protein P5150_08420 [Candidatus Ratteibacteria bacterium]|nr:hypothetical protein [Candidatus Ratteibacteria bacterium]
MKNKNKGIILGLKGVVYVLAGFLFALPLFCGNTAYAEEVPNPFQELISWIAEQNIGLTYLYNLDEGQHQVGAKWNIVKTEHDWLYAGLVSTTSNPSIGIDLSVNLGKLIEKIKGNPLVYLKHLEVGYYTIWELNGWDRTDGVILNVIKLEF